MNLWAHLAAVAAEAGQAGLAHSSIAYADPSAAKQKQGCTPCAAAALLERAQARTAQHTGRAPAPAPRRVRKAIAT